MQTRKSNNPKTGRNTLQTKTREQEQEQEQKQKQKQK